jgi:hypothetical protein
MDFCSMVEQLVACEGEEVVEHYIDERMRASKG